MINLFVLAVLYNNESILLLRRHNASFGNELYSLVGGKVEPGETALQAIQREVFEETGLNISSSSFNFVHLLHRKGTETELVICCFKADIRGLTPYNAEPNKHDVLSFFKFINLPENIIPAHKQIIEYIREGIPYSEHGW